MTKSRKYFGTDGIRGQVGQGNINAEFVLKLGWALGRTLINDGQGKVIIGKDTRISGYLFEAALEAGLTSAGANVELLGPMPTPAIAYLTRALRAQAGIVISASHNAYTDNGIKIFSAEGTKLPDEVELEIERIIDTEFGTVDASALGKAKRVADAPGRYIEFCKNTIPSSVDLKGLHIVLDCANGATYQVAPAVFRELGAQVTLIAASPDGKNINHQCGSTSPQSLMDKVCEVNADIGIALDGDGDRVVLVDQQGQLHDGDDILYILAKHQHERGQLTGGVVGTVMTNLGLEQAFNKLDIPFVRTKVGDRYVIAEMLQRGWLLGGEASGHIICLSCNTTGDGIVAALQVLVAMVDSGCSLSELSGQYQKFPQTMINVQVQQKFDLERLPLVQQAIRDAEATLASSGRVVLRPSGTEPLVRVMVEGENQTQINQVAQQLVEVVKSEVA